MSENKQAYISHVHLKGYKSIRDMEVALLPGLNIIIGPNGSGKTNFLEFLRSVISRDFLKLGNFESKLETIIGEKYYWKKVKEGDIVSIEAKGKRMLSKQLSSKLLVEGTLSINKTVIDSIRITIEDGKIFTIVNPKEYYKHFSVCSFVEHSFPNDMQSITKPARIEFDLELEGQLQNISGKFDFKSDYFFVSLFQQHWTISIEAPEDVVKINPQIQEALKKYTPIEDLRLNSKNFIISRTEDLNEVSHYTIENILTEFKVNGNWLKWNQLSDGTKRMFYIISKIIYETISVNCELILLEEPELGIHPHQLNKLMDFFREQSQHKQIIITTHSPQVLNELRDNELDRINICTFQGDKGTQMEHLTKEDQKYALEYMQTEGLTLSDYWVHSGFKQEEGMI